MGTHKYFKYRPENWVCAITSILPSPCWLIVTVSPRFPTLLSTLILSCRNFSKAETSKILSEAGCDALMMNCHISQRQPENKDIKIASAAQRALTTFFVIFPGFCPFTVCCRWALVLGVFYLPRMILSLLFLENAQHKAREEQQSGSIRTDGGAISSDRGAKKCISYVSMPGWIFYLSRYYI